MSAKSNAKVHQLVLMAVVSWWGLWNKCPRLICLQLLLDSRYSMHLSIYIDIYRSQSFLQNKMMKCSTREGQMEWVTHSGVSVALPRTLPPCILTECRWGLWPGRAKPSEERLMVDPCWQRQSGEGSLLILFDLWSEPENETSERSRLLAAASGWSHRAQVRGITHQWLFYQTCRSTWAGLCSGTEGIMEKFSCCTSTV